METKMELSIIEKICNGRGKDAAEAARYGEADAEEVDG